MDPASYKRGVYNLLKTDPTQQEFDDATASGLPLPTGILTQEVATEFVHLYLFLRNADKSIFDAILPTYGAGGIRSTLRPMSDTELSEFLDTLDQEINSKVSDPPEPMNDMVNGDLVNIFTKIYDAVDSSVTKANIKLLVNNSRKEIEDIINLAAPLVDESSLVSLVNQIRSETSKIIIPPVPESDVVEKKMYKFYAYEKDNSGIEILAEPTNEIEMNDVLTRRENDFITIANANPRIEAIAETLLHKETFLRQPIQFKIPDDIRLLTDKYVGTKDPVLGQGWSSFFRSPVFLADEMTSITAVAGSIKIPIYYYDRKPASIDSAKNVTLYQKANTNNGTAGSTTTISNTARLDTFIENINKIAKMELNDGDPIYLITVEQSPVLKSIMSAMVSSDQCQYLNITIEQSIYSSSNPQHKWGTSKTGCLSPLPSGPLYKPQFDILVTKFLVGPDTTSISVPPSSGLGPVIGGSMNKYTRKFMEPGMYHTRHRKRRISRANMKRKRYNKTRKG